MYWVLVSLTELGRVLELRIDCLVHGVISSQVTGSRCLLVLIVTGLFELALSFVWFLRQLRDIVLLHLCLRLILDRGFLIQFGWWLNILILLRVSCCGWIQRALLLGRCQSVLASVAASKSSAVSIPSRLTLHSTFCIGLLEALFFQYLAVISDLAPLLIPLKRLHLSLVIFLHSLLSVI